MDLRLKITAAVVLVMALLLWAASEYLIDEASHRAMQRASSQTSAYADLIRREIESASAGGHSRETQESLDAIGRADGVIAARVLDPGFKVLKSSDINERGRQSPAMMSGPDVSGRGGVLLQRIMIQYRAECIGCHVLEGGSLGSVEVAFDLTPIQRELAALKRSLVFWGMLLVGLIAGVLGFMLTRVVSAPLETFRRTVRAVKDGDLSARAEEMGRGEMLLLGADFNAMLGEVSALHERALRKEREVSRVKVELDHKVLLEELNAQLQHKVKEVESANKAVLSLSKEIKHKNIELEKNLDRLKRINEVGRVLSSIIDHEDLLKLIIKTTSDTLRVERGTIHVVRNRTRAVTIRYQGGVGFSSEEGGAGIEIDHLFQDMILEGRHILHPDEHETRGRGAALGVPLKMKGQIIGGILLERKHEGGGFTHDELQLLDTMSNQAIVALENAWLYDTVKANYFGTIQALVNALEASDRYTKGHSERVKSLGLELARYLGLDHRELEVFEHAAILHDIGKIGIDTSVLNKEDELTMTEFSLIRAHPIIGDEILGPIGTLEGVRTTILQHHERYDGKGYPYGISGEEITLKARILAVIDTFDAMLSDRPYRRALSVEQAMDEVRKSSGTQFDPSVVKAFFEMLRENEGLIGTAGYRGR